MAVVEQLEVLVAEAGRIKALKDEKVELENQKLEMTKDLTEKIRQKQAEITAAEGDDDYGDGDHGERDAGEGNDTSSDTTNTNTTTKAAARKLLASLRRNPEAYLEKVLLDLELVASHVTRLKPIKEQVPALLKRAITALETILYWVGVVNSPEVEVENQGHGEPETSPPTLPKSLSLFDPGTELPP